MNGRPILQASILTLALRVFYSALAAFAGPRLAIDPLMVRANDLTSNLIPASDTLRYALFGMWERFDTLWYINIAQHGYKQPQAIVFYPGYPLLIKLLLPIVREPVLAALLVSTAATFFLFWGFHKLLSLDLPEDAVRRGLILYAAWPAGFILFAGYPESLVAALMIWSIYFARTGAWWWAGMMGAAAGATKAVGILVAVPLFLLARRKPEKNSWAWALSLAGPAAYMAFVHFLDFGSMSDVYAKHWRTRLAFPWETLLESTMGILVALDPALILNLAALAVFFVLTLKKRLRPEYTAFALAVLCLFLIKRTDPLLQSTLRYVMAVFPVFASLGALLRNNYALAVVAIPSFCLNLFLFLLFLQWALLV